MASSDEPIVTGFRVTVLRLTVLGVTVLGVTVLGVRVLGVAALGIGFMASLGEKLKEARLKQGLTLAELAGRTRIQTHFLEAIERNDLDVIPGAFFRKSFVRQYALALGLEANEFEADTTIQFGAHPAGQSVSQVSLPTREQPDLPPLPSLGRDGGRPWKQIALSVGLLVGVVAVCAVAYRFWEDFQSRERSGISNAPPVQMSSAPETPTPAPSVAIPGQNEVQPDAESDSSAILATGSAGSPAEEPAAQPGQVATVPDGAPADPSPTVYGSGTRELRLTADSLTWVRVREGERTLYTGTIDVGQSRVIRVSEGAQILTGNAGSLKVFWQGNAVGKIGPDGQVRTVVFTPDGFQIQAPAPKAPSSGAEPPETLDQGR